MNATAQPVRGQPAHNKRGELRKSLTIPMHSKFQPPTEDIWKLRCAEAGAMAWSGATQTEIANFFEVTPRALLQWGHEHPPFREALSLRSKESDERVVRALYEKAISGDNVAMTFWLKNRLPTDWRDRHEIDATAALQVNMTDDTKMAQAIAMIFANALAPQAAGAVIDVTANKMETEHENPAEPTRQPDGISGPDGRSEPRTDDSSSYDDGPVVGAGQDDTDPGGAGRASPVPAEADPFDFEWTPER